MKVPLFLTDFNIISMFELHAVLVMLSALPWQRK